MACAGVNLSAASYTADIWGWHRPEDYQAPGSIQGFSRELQIYIHTNLRKRQMGLGVDAGAMLVSYKYSPNKWGWNGMEQWVFMKDAYVTNSLNLVFESRYWSYGQEPQFGWGNVQL